MISLGYARQQENEICVTRLSDGAPLANGAGVDGLLVSRLDFDVQVLSIPRVPDSEVDGLIRYRLRSIYPGNPGDTSFDYRLESDGVRQTAVVFIARKKVLEGYKSAAGQKPIYLPYALIQRIARARKDVRVWFCHPAWVEMSTFRAGMLVSSAVVPREEGELDFAHAEGVEQEDARAFPLLLIACNDEIDRIRQQVPLAQVLTFQVLESALRNIDGLFREQKRAPTLFTPVARITGLVLIVAILGTIVFFKRVWIAEDHTRTLKKTFSTLETQSQRTISLEKEVDALRSELARMDSARPQDLYLFLSELTGVLGGDVQIRSLQVQGDTFQIEAAGSNPLKLMEGFRDSALFDAVKLSQVVPDARSGKERFSFSGVFHAR